MKSFCSFGFLLVSLFNNSSHSLGLLSKRGGHRKVLLNRGYPRCRGEITAINHSTRYIVPYRLTTTTQIFGLDYDAMKDDEECELFIRPLALSGIDSIGGLERLKDTQLPPSKCFQLESPDPSISPEDVVRICMDSLKNNDEPLANSGLEVCFNFSSDRCRSAYGGSLQDFIAYAANPTFSCMVNCREWKILSIGPEIVGTQVRGAMKTVLILVQPSSDRIAPRRFLWTLQKERRPPRQGCWLVHECLFVDNAYEMTL